jgi:hypothetical protein
MALRDIEREHRNLETVADHVADYLCTGAALDDDGETQVSIGKRNREIDLLISHLRNMWQINQSDHFLDEVVKSLKARR